MRLSGAYLAVTASYMRALYAVSTGCVGGVIVLIGRESPGVERFECPINIYCPKVCRPASENSVPDVAPLVFLHVQSA